jgi:hypothetical protein
MKNNVLILGWQRSALAAALALWALSAALPAAAQGPSGGTPTQGDEAAPSVAPNPLPSPGPPLQSPTSPTPALPKLDLTNPDTLEPEKPNLAWHTVLDRDTVAIELTDSTSHYRVDRIALIGPDGTRIYAPQVTRQVERSFATVPVGPEGPFSFDVKGGSASGVGLGLGLGGPVHTRNVDKKPKTVTRARIELPDPKAYRAQWTRWKISAELVDSEGTASTTELPAPGP